MRIPTYDRKVKPIGLQDPGVSGGSAGGATAFVGQALGAAAQVLGGVADRQFERDKEDMLRSVRDTSLSITARMQDSFQKARAQSGRAAEQSVSTFDNDFNTLTAPPQGVNPRVWQAAVDATRESYLSHRQALHNHAETERMRSIDAQGEAAGNQDVREAVNTGVISWGSIYGKQDSVAGARFKDPEERAGDALSRSTVVYRAAYKARLDNLIANGLFDQAQELIKEGAVVREGVPVAGFADDKAQNLLDSARLGHAQMTARAEKERDEAGLVKYFKDQAADPVAARAALDANKYGFSAGTLASRLSADNNRVETERTARKRSDGLKFTKDALSAGTSPAEIATQLEAAGNPELATVLRSGIVNDLLNEQAAAAKAGIAVRMSNVDTSVIVAAQARGVSLNDPDVQSMLSTDGQLWVANRFRANALELEEDRAKLLAAQETQAKDVSAFKDLTSGKYEPLAMIESAGTIKNEVYRSYIVAAAKARLEAQAPNAKDYTRVLGAVFAAGGPAEKIITELSTRGSSWLSNELPEGERNVQLQRMYDTVETIMRKQEPKNQTPAFALEVFRNLATNLTGVVQRGKDLRTAPMMFGFGEYVPPEPGKTLKLNTGKATPAADQMLQLGAAGPAKRLVEPFVDASKLGPQKDAPPTPYVDYNSTPLGY